MTEFGFVLSHKYNTYSKFSELRGRDMLLYQALKLAYPKAVIEFKPMNCVVEVHGGCQCTITHDDQREERGHRSAMALTEVVEKITLPSPELQKTADGDHRGSAEWMWYNSRLENDEGSPLLIGRDTVPRQWFHDYTHGFAGSVAPLAMREARENRRGVFGPFYGNQGSFESHWYVWMTLFVR